jgi:hypothetical protein
MSEQTPQSPPRASRQLSAVDLLVIGFEALSAAEQDDALARLQERHLQREAGIESEAGRLISDLRQAAEHCGEGDEIAWDAYKQVRNELRGQGIELADINQIVRHFGSWRVAKEALTLSATTPVARIEARFRSRRLGKVWRYTDETLRDTLARCVADIGHVPQVAEYEWWRKREIELAEAQGNDALHLPAATPFRNRWKTWAGALLHFGYSQAEIDGRLERP